MLWANARHAKTTYEPKGNDHQYDSLGEKIICRV